MRTQRPPERQILDCLARLMQLHVKKNRQSVIFLSEVEYGLPEVSSNSLAVAQSVFGLHLSFHPYKPTCLNRKKMSRLNSTAATGKMSMVNMHNAHVYVDPKADRNNNAERNSITLTVTPKLTLNQT